MQEKQNTETMKHTEGEWETRISSHKDYIAVDAVKDGTLGRSLMYKHFNPESPHFKEEYYQETKANAKLIAAAPDLLEALHGAMRIVDLWKPCALPQDVKECDISEFAALAMMRQSFEKAISKATA